MRDQQNYILATSPFGVDNPNGDALSPQEIGEFITSNSELVGLRTNQTIGWDESKKIFTIATYSVTPLVNKKLNDGSNVVGPLFHLYPHRRFKTVPK